MHKIFICMLIFICHVTLSIYSYAFENKSYYNSNGLKISKTEYDERCAKQSVKYRRSAVCTEVFSISRNSLTTRII